MPEGSEGEDVSGRKRHSSCSEKRTKPSRFSIILSEETKRCRLDFTFGIDFSCCVHLYYGVDSYVSCGPL